MPKQRAQGAWWCHLHLFSSVVSHLFGFKLFRCSTSKRSSDPSSSSFAGAHPQLPQGRVLNVHGRKWLNAPRGGTFGRPGGNAGETAGAQGLTTRVPAAISALCQRPGPAESGCHGWAGTLVTLKVKGLSSYCTEERCLGWRAPSLSDSFFLEGSNFKPPEEMLLFQMVDRGFQGQFDLLYIPYNQECGYNMGYGIVNCTRPEYAMQFYSLFHGECLDEEMRMTGRMLEVEPGEFIWDKFRSATCGLPFQEWREGHTNCGLYCVSIKLQHHHHVRFGQKPTLTEQHNIVQEAQLLCDSVTPLFQQYPVGRGAWPKPSQKLQALSVVRMLLGEDNHKLDHPHFHKSTCVHRYVNCYISVKNIHVLVQYTYHYLYTYNVWTGIWRISPVAGFGQREQVGQDRHI